MGGQFDMYFLDHVRLRHLLYPYPAPCDQDKHELRIGMFILPSRVPRADDLARVLGNNCRCHIPVWVSPYPL